MAVCQILIGQAAPQILEGKARAGALREVPINEPTDGVPVLHASSRRILSPGVKRPGCMHYSACLPVNGSPIVRVWKTRRPHETQVEHAIHELLTFKD